MYCSLARYRLRTHEQWVSALGEDYALGPELLARLLLGLPELLTLPHQAGISSNALAPWCMTKAPAYPSGVVMFHSLSPLGDTAFLLASLGQARRLASILGLPLSIALADVDVARHNRIVAVFGEAQLCQNRAWRLALYSAIGARTQLASLNNLPGVPDSSVLERANWVDAQKPPLQHDPSPEGRVRRELFACLEAYFGVTDRRTALYFLAQRHHQHRFAGYLKLGNPSERRFDEPAQHLDVAEYGTSRGVSQAMYLDDYAMGRSARSAVTLHAYCFPSGTAFERTRSVEFCRSVALHLSDLGRPRHAQEAFSALRPPHDARFLADLLSFIHFCAAERRDPAPSEIGEALARVLPEWAQSWNHYAVEAAHFRVRAHEWFERSRVDPSSWPPPPYYVFPFLLEEARRGQLVLEVVPAVARWLTSYLASLRGFYRAELPAPAHQEGADAALHEGGGEPRATRAEGGTIS